MTVRKPINLAEQKMDKSIGLLLRAYRLLCNKSQVSLAHDLGLTGQQIYHYEVGRSTVSVSRLITICNHLGASPEDFIRDIEVIIRREKVSD